jgi:hypothetical protein
MSLDKVRFLLEQYAQGQIPTLAQHEVHPQIDPGSRTNYLYFTLPVCINFQRSSPAMWAAALATYNDPQTSYVFFPEQLATAPIEQIRADLLKHKLSLQPNKHTLIWTTIANTLHQHFDDDPRQIIRLANHNVGDLLTILQRSHKQYFPFLSGPKLSNYWPYILSQFTDVKFNDMHAISIIPDTHIIQSSIKLGVVPSSATPLQVEAAWKELLKDSGINAVQVHPVLWNWSRNNFNPEV